MAKVYNISAILRRHLELQINHHYAEIEKSRMRMREIEARLALKGQLAKPKIEDDDPDCE